MTHTTQALAPLLTLRQIGKTFANGTVALAGADLSIKRGEFLSLLGPSGCGKSTLLRLIAGLSHPSTGQIEWSGSKHPELGFVFQEPTLMPWADVEHNVWLPLRLKGVALADARGRIAEVLELVGLSKFGKAYPRELSGGMKMRVSLARAFMLQPDVLLMDEPFAALDEITRLKLNNDLLRLKERLGTTIIFVTHSVYESVYLSNRVAVFAARPGRIVRIIDIDVDRPRDEAFRQTPTYLDGCRTASEALLGAMSAEDHL